MLTDVNLVICFPVSTLHTRVSDLKNNIFSKKTWRHNSLPEKALPLSSFFFLSNDFRDIKSFSLYKCWFVLPQLPRAFICISNSTGYTSRLFKKCKPTMQQQMAFCASGLNKAQDEYILKRGLSKLISAHPETNYFFINKPSGMSRIQTHNPEAPGQIRVCSGELVNADNNRDWWTDPHFSGKRLSLPGPW